VSTIKQFSVATEQDLHPLGETPIRGFPQNVDVVREQREGVNDQNSFVNDLSQDVQE
jgi:hypothetical protein